MLRYSSFPRTTRASTSTGAARPVEDDMNDGRMEELEAAGGKSIKKEEFSRVEHNRKPPSESQGTKDRFEEQKKSFRFESYRDLRDACMKYVRTWLRLYT